MHELLQAQICSPFLFKFFYLIESLQFLFFAVHPSLTFVWKSKIVEYFRDVLSYIEVSH